MTRRLLGFAVVMLGLACDDTSAPFTMAGTWLYVAPTMADAAYPGTCRVSLTTLTLTQTADSVHGTTGLAHHLICTPTGGMPDTITTIPANLLVRGRLDAASLTFQIDGSYWQHTGTRAATTFSGTMSLATTVGSTPVNLMGTWSAMRQ